MIKKIILKFLFLITITSIFSGNVYADTPISLYQSFAGNVNFIGVQATRRTQSNSGDACAVMPANNTNTASVTTIPAGATIRAAHLYWAGSYSAQAGSTQTTPDYSVVFEGSTITADRQYTSSYDASEKYFSGVEDVTAQVITKRNGTYSFSGLSVNTASPHCDYAVVMAGWALVIVYEHPNEDFRVVNLFEGFQLIYGNSVTLTPSNFTVPNAPINGKHAYLTWDGDSGNSSSKNGYSEGITFNGTVLSDANNPVNSQFNSISTINGVDNNSHGVDFDLYTIDSLLSAGDTSATSIYSSGGDQVHLSMEIISVTNTPVSDLANRSEPPSRVCPMNRSDRPLRRASRDESRESPDRGRSRLMPCPETAESSSHPRDRMSAEVGVPSQSPTGLRPDQSHAEVCAP